MRVDFGYKITFIHFHYDKFNFDCVFSTEEICSIDSDYKHHINFFFYRKNDLECLFAECQLQAGAGRKEGLEDDVEANVQVISNNNNNYYYYKLN